MCWICGGGGCLSCEGSIIQATTEAELLFLRFAEDQFALLPVADPPPDETPRPRLFVIAGGKDTKSEKNE